MHEVTPKAFVMCETGMMDPTKEFLDEIGASNWHLPTNVESDCEGIIEVAGRTCYKSFGVELNANLTRVRTDHREYIGNILKTHHGSVLEHATTTVGLANVSRILTHELVRHRAGCAYSQESMRFVRLDDIGMYIPECIKADALALEMFKQQVMSAEIAVKALTDRMITDDMPFSKKKEITSAIRRIAPGGHSTNIVITANHRAWRHLIEMRTAYGAEEEIRVLFVAIAKQFRSRYPALYQDMIYHSTGDNPIPEIVFLNSKV